VLNFPSQNASTRLYSACTAPVSIAGQARRSIVGRMGPFRILSRTYLGFIG
jgi:hypothetical protein